MAKDKKKKKYPEWASEEAKKDAEMQASRITGKKPKKQKPKNDAQSQASAYASRVTK